MIAMNTTPPPVLVASSVYGDAHLGLSDDQLAARRVGIGSSDVAAVLGLSKHRTPFDVYLSKRGLVERSPMTGAQEWGHIMEPVLADRYIGALQSGGLSVWGRTPGTFAHHAAPWALATPDRIIETANDVDDAAWLLEIKTRSQWQAGEWGAPGTDEIPHEVAVQAHWQLLVMGLARCDVVVLIGGNDYRAYTVHGDRALHDALLTQVGDWHAQHIIGGEEPALTGQGAADYVARRFARTLRDTVDVADDEAASALEQLATARAEIAALDARKRDIETYLKSRIGDAKGIRSEDGHRAVWSDVKGRASVDWEAVARAAGAGTELIRQHTALGAGYRAFRFTAAKEAA